MGSRSGLPGKEMEELQVVVVEARDGHLPLACSEGGTCTSCQHKNSCQKALCVPSAGLFSHGFYAFCDDNLVSAIYGPAGLSPLFISHGCHCTAVNHCKADSLVSSNKFRCWKKTFVYSCASLL